MKPIIDVRRASGTGVRALCGRTACAAAIGMLACLSAAAQSPGPAIQVAGDSACPYYADDIAAFATCEGSRVVKPEALTAADATDRIVVLGSAGTRVAISAVGRAAAPMHRSRGVTGSQPRR